MNKLGFLGVIPLLCLFPSQAAGRVAHSKAVSTWGFWIDAIGNSLERWFENPVSEHSGATNSLPKLDGEVGVGEHNDSDVTDNVIYRQLQAGILCQTTIQPDQTTTICWY
jgi:hypothetical protein